MSSESLSTFLRDERGSYTLWSLVWFMVYVGVGGVAVDATDAYRHQTLLQATADSAAMAGAFSLPDKDKAVNYALAYADANMSRESHGTVLTERDVQVGTWNFTAETFTPDTPVPNAVYVVTRRAVENENPVRMNLLRFLELVGLDLWWNVKTEAVAVRAISKCHNNGLIANNLLTLTSNNEYLNNICLHGQFDGIDVREGNLFGDGVSVSTGCTDCVGPSSLENTMDNEGFPPAWARGGANEPLFPLNAQAAGDYVEVLRSLPDLQEGVEALSSIEGADYSDWSYLFHDDGSAPVRRSWPPDPDEGIIEHSIYEIDCSGNRFDLDLVDTDGTGVVQNIGIVANCRLSGSADVALRNVVIGTDWRPPGDNFQQNGISFSANAQIGDNDCEGDGGVELYTPHSSMHFAARGQIHGARLISGYDVQVAANTDARNGIHVEAMNDIQMPARTKWGLCPNGVENGPKQYTYRLMR